MFLIQQLIDEHKLNLITLLFYVFIGAIVILGALVNFIEAYLPTSISQSFRYGKHCHKGKQDAIVARLEVPKSWFKHFYVFAFSWALLALFLVLKCIILREAAPEYVLAFLDLIGGGSQRKVQVNSTCALVATVLMTLQCARRFYETNFVQIFSNKSKINLSHYFVGYLHYFGTIVTLLANTEGFVRGTQPSTFSFSKLTLLQYACIFAFHFAFTQQYKANMILVNLRKDAKTGHIKTEAHLLPRGGLFEYVSSPHMLTEILMYAALLSILPNCSNWKLIVLWVLTNQFWNAILTHKWYKENFKNYPKTRKILFPFLF